MTDFDKEFISAEYKSGYNKGRKDMAIESIVIFVLCVFIGWIIL